MDPTINISNSDDFNRIKESSVIVTNKSNSKSLVNHKFNSNINNIDQNPNPNPNNLINIQTSDSQSPLHAKPTIIVDTDTLPLSRPTSIASSPSRHSGLP